MNGQQDLYVPALTYYVLSKVGEPDHWLAVVCEQTEGIFCCSCHAWSCSPEAFRQHKRSCDGFKAWDEDSVKALKLMYSEFTSKPQKARPKKLETAGLPIPGFLVSAQVKANRAAKGPNGEKAEYPHLHLDAAVCLLCTTCSVRHGRAAEVQKCCNSFFISRGLKAVVHDSPRRKTFLVLDVPLDAVVPVNNPKHPNVQMVDATRAWNELVATAVPEPFYSRHYDPRLQAPGASAAFPAPGWGTTTTTTTTASNGRYPAPGQVMILEADRKRQKPSHFYVSPFKDSTVDDPKTAKLVSIVSASDLQTYNAVLQGAPSAHKSMHSTEDLLWQRLKLGALGLGGAVRLAVLADEHSKPKNFLSSFVCRGVEQFVRDGQTMLMVVSPTHLRAIYNLALEEQMMGSVAQGPIPPRSFNAVTEPTASARAHILSRVFMVDCALGV